MEPDPHGEKGNHPLYDDDTTILGDRGLCRELIMNLLDNAVKYNRRAVTSTLPSAMTVTVPF